MAVLGALQAAFAAGFTSGTLRMGSMLSTGDVARPDFNALYVKAISDTKGGLNIKDLQNLEKIIRTFEPEMMLRFQRDAKKLGDPARKAVDGAFKKINRSGPLGPVKREGRRFDKMATEIGRLSWGASRSRRNVVDVNYKRRSSAALNRSISSGFGAKDKTLSLIRVRVKGPAYIVADMARAGGKSNRATGTRTRRYQINLYGKGIVTRDHKINAENVKNWLGRLSEIKAPSRYAWPAFEGHAKDYRTNFSGILNQLVSETNRKSKS